MIPIPIGFFASSVAVIPVDPYYSLVVLLFHFDGANGATSTIDSSSYAHSSTISGASLSTSLAKFGPSSLLANGTGQVTVATHSELVVGTSDFTCEAFVYQTSDSGNFRLIAGGDDSTANAGRWFLGITNNNYLSMLFEGNNFIASTAAVTVGAWKHCAYSRTSGVGYLFLDGVLVGSGADSNYYSTATQFRVGGTGGGGNPIPGYVDEFRLTIGVGRYTAAFAPPTAPFYP